MPSDKELICKESYGSQASQVKFIFSEDNEGVSSELHPRRTFASVKQFLTNVFLPQGYPHSVSSDYLEYQLWDTLQAFASSMTGTLATQAVLKGVGVGDATATPLAATLTWLLKDGTGMLGRIFFAWFKGSSLDCDCKKWRLFADILNDAALFLELLAPSFKTGFTVVVCVSGFCKSIVGVAGGATRAALIQHQSRRDNLADVSAKDGSQETLVNLAALLFSLVLMPFVSGNEGFIWICFVIFTLVHIYANYRAVTSIVMETLNQSRFYILLSHYIKTGGNILSTTEANRLESVFLRSSCPFSIKLGCSVTEAFNTLADLKQLNHSQPQYPYLINFNLKKSTIAIVLNKESTNESQLKACFEAMALVFCAENFNNDLFILNSPLPIIMRELQSTNYQKDTILRLTREFTDHEFPLFVEALCEKGWNVRHILLNADEWRVTWLTHNRGEGDYDRLHSKLELSKQI